MNVTTIYNQCTKLVKSKIKLDSHEMSIMRLFLINIRFFLISINQLYKYGESVYLG